MSTRILKSPSPCRCAMTRMISAGATSMVSSPRANVTPVTAPPSADLMLSVNAARSAISALDGSGAADLPLQQQDAVDQRLGGGRTAGHIDVDRHDTVAAAHHGIGIMVIAAAVGAGSHRDHITRLRHLVVNLAQGGRHLVGQCA